MDSDEVRSREAIQGNADDIEEPADAARGRIHRRRGDHRGEGRIVKRLGDGLMATFLSPEAAVKAALDAQDAIRDIEVEAHKPRMRVGVHWGRPRKLGGDYLGVDVNVAARVAAAARADQVLISDALLGRIDREAVRTGRAKRLRADGAPSGLRVVRVTRP
jgi:adenylate cyclase